MNLEPELGFLGPVDSEEVLDEIFVSIWVFSGDPGWSRSGVAVLPSDQLARLNAWFSYPFHRSGSYR